VLLIFSKKVTQQAPSIEGSSSKIPLQILLLLNLENAYRELV